MRVVRRDTIVVGASAGGVEALRELVAGLPADLPAAVLVVLHLPAGGASALASVLHRSGPLPAVEAANAQPLRPGTVAVAPPDRHLLVVDGHTVLSRGPTENGHRPAVDALFRSAARARGPRVIGVQLSGSLDDGAAGMVAIAGAHGAVVVQDPQGAIYPGMPESVLRLLTADHVLPVAKIPAVLADLTAADLPDDLGPGISELERVEVDLALEGDRGMENQLQRFGDSADFSCPDCGGVLIALQNTGRFRCRVGHAWTQDALLDIQGDKYERALWTAYRLLEEKASLATRMERMAREQGNAGMERRHGMVARESGDAAVVLRELLLGGLPADRAFRPDSG